MGHEDCHQRATHLPKRVVDISDSRYRLVEPEGGLTGRYAALSYSWGKRGFQMTTSKNYRSFQGGIDRDTVPILFQDAASIAHRLNIRYLWIDAMCIIQDSRSDWEEQVAKMADIFENAAITIAASASSDPGVSIFARRQLDHQEVELGNGANGRRLNATFKARRKIQFGIHAKSQWSTEVDPLDLRAWALQEKELSTRFISYTGAELQWKCRKIKTCECHEMPYPSQGLFWPSTAPLSGDQSSRNLVAWTRVVEEFSSRNLRVIEDRLPALLGLASKFYAMTGLTYIAGLWRENIVSDLVWQRGSKNLLAPLTGVVPSFSWVSVPGPVNFQLGRYSYDGIRECSLELLQVDYANTDSKPTSRAVEGSLTARGYTVAARLRSSTSTDPQAYEICIGDTVYPPNTGQRASCEFSIDTLLMTLSNGECEHGSEVARVRSVDHDLDRVDGSIRLLSLYSIHHQDYVYENFLILGKSPTNSHSYERIGVGTGKIYSDGGLDGGCFHRPRLVRPFQWLALDLEKKGSCVKDIAEEVICIR